VSKAVVGLEPEPGVAFASMEPGTGAWDRCLPRKAPQILVAGPYGDTLCPTPSHTTIPRRFGSTGVVTAGPIQEPSKILQAGPSTVRNCVLLYSNRPSGEIEASWKA